MTTRAALITISLISLSFGSAACKKESAETPTTEPVAETPSTDNAEVAQEVKPAEDPEPAAPAAPETGDEATGTYVIDGWTLTFTPKEAALSREGVTPNRILYSQTQGEKECKEGAVEGMPADDFEYDVSGKLLFVLDDTFGYEMINSGFCGGAHPFAYQNFETVKPGLPEGEQLTLLEFFNEKDIMDALNADETIKKVRANPDALCVVAPEDAKVSNFAIRSVSGGVAQVMISMPYAYEACRDSFEVTTVSLPPKDKEILAQLERAQAKGLLMDQLYPNYSAK